MSSPFVFSYIIYTVLLKCKKKRSPSFNRKSGMQKPSHPGNICLFLTERHTVGALIHSGIALVGAYQNAVQGTVVCITAMVCTLGNGAFDALVGMTVHKRTSFDFGFGNSMTLGRISILENVSNVAFWKNL